MTSGRRVKAWTIERAGGFVLLAVLAGGPLWAQPPATAPPTAPAEPAGDPLGRETPRGSLLGFMRAAREGNDAVAAQFLNSTLDSRPAQALARQLFIVLDNRLPARIDGVSDRPDGRLANPLSPDQELIARITTTSGVIDIAVERVRQAGGPPVWLFSRSTLEAIPAAYQDVDLISFDQYLPGFLAKPHLAGIRLFHWLTLLLVVPLVFRLMGTLTRMWVPAARRLGLGRFVPAGVGPQRLSGAIRFLVLALVIRGLIATSDLPFIERQFWTAIAILFTIGAATWLLLHVNASIERYFRNGLQWSGRTDVASLLRIGRWFADGLVLLVAVLVVIKRLGGDPTAALAGVGIGGIAVALAAQKTLENVIGGLSLIFDQAVRVGDFLKVGEASGTVDSIGLRSTRIRTLDRTILSVPNGQIANVSIETISSRDMFWFHHYLGLRYETTPAQIRAVVGGIVRRLAGHPAIDPASVRAKFLRFGPSSLDIEVVAYILVQDWARFLEIQEELLLGMMEVVEQADTAIALPSQTLHLAATSPLVTALQPAAVRRPEGV